MTKAELIAHQTLPDETLGDSYTMTHKREREAFVKGWHKAVELCCEWLKFNYVEFTDNSRLGLNVNELIKDFKKRFKKSNGGMNYDTRRKSKSL